MSVLNPADPSHSNHLISTNGRYAERVWGDLLLEETQDDLVRFALESDLEICGFITVDQDIFMVKNIHEEPKYNFFMDFDSCSETIREITEVKKSRIMGVFHTHPNNQPWPSPRDIVGWPNLALNWRYWIATRKEVLEWRLV